MKNAVGMMTVSANDCSGMHDSRHPKQSDCGSFQAHRIICALQHFNIDKADRLFIMNADEQARTYELAGPAVNPGPIMPLS